MAKGHVAVLDVGKTRTKLSLWTHGGEEVARTSRRNCAADGAVARGLDAAAIEGWLGSALASLNGAAPIGALIPVAHGAAAVLVQGGEVALPPRDYEQPIDPGVRRAYDAERDTFAATGSPALPLGLNLGAQLYAIEEAEPRLFSEGLQLLLWPQYWAWRLSGVAASEVSSLGCHSDLWRPREKRFSDLARRRGWARAFPPIHGAGEVLGFIDPRWAARTGIDPRCRIHCGLHDSNAALEAARGPGPIASREITLVSTGTWFVAMRALAQGTEPDIAGLDPAAGCLVNVDVRGRAVPSARFMGGREIESLLGTDSESIDRAADQNILIAAAQQVAASDVMILPGAASSRDGCTAPEPGWFGQPNDPVSRRAATALYAALMTDVLLERVGARGAILIEGRFAAATLFARALASLRPHDHIATSRAPDGVALGALRLVAPESSARIDPLSAEPLAFDLGPYRQRWRARLSGNEGRA